MKRFLSVLLIFVAQSVVGATTTLATIDKLRIAQSAITDNAEVITNVSDCNGILNLNLINESDDVALSMLMTAKVTGQPVVITYTVGALCEITAVKVE